MIPNQSKILVSLESNDGPNLNDFPVEILCQIFIHSVPKQPSSDSVSTPLVLCGVSSQWRHIATSLPYIWTHLYINIAKYTDTPDNLIRLGDLWIDRSHWLPIHVFIRGESNTNVINPFLYRFSSKFQTLSMNLFNYADSAPELIGFGTEDQTINLQALETLNLNIFGRLSVPPQVLNLRKLRIKLLPVPMDPTPWAQLTHLDVTFDIEFSQLMDVLSRCPNLVEGEFYIKEYSSTPVGLVSLPAPILPQLKRLVLHTMSMPKLANLPQQVFTSAGDLGLMSLRHSPEDFEHNVPICGVIERLTLSMQPWKSVNLVQILKKFDAVTSLTLFCAPGSKKMNAFLRDLAATPLLPRLTHFNLYICIVKGFDFSLYQSFISDRWSVDVLNARARLKTCSLVFVLGDGSERSSYELMVMDIRKRMKPLVDDGLEFSTDILDTFPSVSWGSF